MTYDSKYIYISGIESAAGTQNLLYLAPLPEDPADLATIQRDENGCVPVIKVKDKFESEYEYITSDGDSFVFKTNCKAPNNRVVRFSVDKADEADW